MSQGYAGNWNSKDLLLPTDPYQLYDGKIMVLQNFSFEKFLTAIETGALLVDFDARSGHNHGTKFRLRQDFLPMLYETAVSL
jgi:hypothetical protein